MNLFLLPDLLTTLFIQKQAEEMQDVVVMHAEKTVNGLRARKWMLEQIQSNMDFAKKHMIQHGQTSVNDLSVDKFLKDSLYHPEVLKNLCSNLQNNPCYEPIPNNGASAYERLEFPPLEIRGDVKVSERNSGASAFKKIANKVKVLAALKSPMKMANANKEDAVIPKNNMNSSETPGVSPIEVIDQTPANEDSLLRAAEKIDAQPVRRLSAINVAEFDVQNRSKSSTNNSGNLENVDHSQAALGGETPLLSEMNLENNNTSVISEQVARPEIVLGNSRRGSTAVDLSRLNLTTNNRTQKTSRQINRGEINSV